MESCNIRSIKIRGVYGTEEQAKQMIADLWVSEEEYKFQTPHTIGGHCVVYLGQLVKENAVYDEQGEIVTEAVLYNDYAVDVAWKPKQDVVEYDEEGEEISTEVPIQDWEEWTEFETDIENRKHTFA